VCIQHSCRIWKLFPESTGVRDLTTGYGHFDVHNLLRAGIYEHTLPTMSLSEDALTPRILPPSIYAYTYPSGVKYYVLMNLSDFT